MNDIQQSTLPLMLSFKDDIAITNQDNRVAIQLWKKTISLEHTSTGIRAVLQALSSGDGATEQQLVALFKQHEGESGLPILFYSVQKWIQLGMICHTVFWQEVKLATLIPLTATAPFSSLKPSDNQRYLLSRFAYLHQEGEQWILESPLAHSKMVLHDGRAMALLHTLAKPINPSGLCRQFPDISTTVVSSLLTLLLGDHYLSTVDEKGQIDETQTLAQWEFHDLLFHARSRQGRHANRHGADHIFQGHIEPLPVVKPPMSNQVIGLYKPDIERLKNNDVPFTRVLEQRCSIREPGEPPITVKQLGEFLYRTARVREIIKAEQRPYERSNRPYPSGGASYEMELYIIVNHCEGLAAGLYHYSPNEHTLEKLTDRTPELETLLKSAYYATAEYGLPQTLIILAARFQRVMWRYNFMAYTAILKHVGVLFQNMYLVATGMGLAPCAVGGGDSDLFAAVAETDYYAETSVGEFILSSRATKSKL